MSFLNKSYVELRCDLALDKDNCRGCRAFYAGTQADAEKSALEMGWVKRGWKHYCPPCVRRLAIEQQR